MSDNRTITSASLPPRTISPQKGFLKGQAFRSSSSTRGGSGGAPSKKPANSPVATDTTDRSPAPLPPRSEKSQQNGVGKRPRSPPRKDHEEGEFRNREDRYQPSRPSDDRYRRSDRDDRYDDRYDDRRRKRSRNDDKPSPSPPWYHRDRRHHDRSYDDYDRRDRDDYRYRDSKRYRDRSRDRYDDRYDHRSYQPRDRYHRHSPTPKTHRDGDRYNTQQKSRRYSPPSRDHHIPEKNQGTLSSLPPPPPAPKLPSAPPSPPRSPDIRQLIDTIFHVYAVQDPTNISESENNLSAKILQVEHQFRGSEAYIWEEQQQLQRQLLLEFIESHPSPFTAVTGRPSYEKVVNSGSDPKSDPETIPYYPDNQQASTGVVVDPRIQYRAEYIAEAAWVAQARPIPYGFRLGGDGIGRSKQLLSQRQPLPAVSWSRDQLGEGFVGEPEIASKPPKALMPPNIVNPTLLKSSVSSRPPPPSGPPQHRFMSSFGNGMDGQAPSPSMPNGGASLTDALPRCTSIGAIESMRESDKDVHHSLHRNNLGLQMTLSQHHQDTVMQIDQGAFEVTAPRAEYGRSKSERIIKPYNELLELVKLGEIPCGWPVYREQDGLWVPLQEHGISMARIQAQQRRAQCVDADSSALTLQVCNGPLSKEKEKSIKIDKTSGAEWVVARLRADDADVAQKESLRASATENIRVCSIPTSYPNSIVSGCNKGEAEENKAGNGGALEWITSLDETVVQKDLREAKRIYDLEYKTKSGPSIVPSMEPPAHLIAAVQGTLLSSEAAVAAVRQVAKAVLQDALRKVIQQQKRKR